MLLHPTFIMNLEYLRRLVHHLLILLNADTMMKFASFETVVEMIYKYAIPAPKSECSKNLQLGVSFAGGYIAGVFCAIVSHPADNLVSFLNNAQGATVGDVGFQDIFCSGMHVLLDIYLTNICCLHRL